MALLQWWMLVWIWMRQNQQIQYCAGNWRVESSSFFPWKAWFFLILQLNSLGLTLFLQGWHWKNAKQKRAAQLPLEMCLQGWGGGHQVSPENWVRDDNTALGSMASCPIRKRPRASRKDHQPLQQVAHLPWNPGMTLLAKEPKVCVSQSLPWGPKIFWSTGMWQTGLRSYLSPRGAIGTIAGSPCIWTSLPTRGKISR